jgi:translation initiation factor 2B subunit (eIF-2B alpha/beta/delta family)
VLAALLRLADACHVDKTRAPQRVMDLYISLGMPKEARLHWERANLIRNVSFDHIERRIVLKGHYPPTVSFGLGVFDLKEVGEKICQNVREELSSVQQMLSHFPNTSFQKVEHDARLIISRGYQHESECLHLWPYLLSRPFSATEAAMAMARMLLLSTKKAEESVKLSDRWRKQMSQIMKETQSLRQHDFMIRNLCIDVENLLLGLSKKAKSATTLTGYLNRFMKSIEKNCGKVVGRARRVIGANDVLVLYGHSINIDLLLRDIDKNHSVYIVDCYKPLDSHRMFDENKKIVELVKDLGFPKYKFLQLESLVAALRELKGKTPCKVLLGTHGRLKNGDFLCKVGSDIIAATAKRFGAQVIAFCESMKFLVNSIKDDEIAGPKKIFSSEDEKMHPQLVNVPYVAPKMDRVPKSFVDIVITESGVERRRKPAKRGAGAGKGRSKRKKANKAK